MAAVPAVPSFATGQVTVTKLTQLGDAINFALSPPMAALRQTSAQTLTTGVFTVLTFDAEDLDTHAGHDNVTNNSRYTARYAGYYEVGGGYAFAANATGRRLCRPQVNGTSVTGSMVGVQGNASIISNPMRPGVRVFLDVGDYVELAAYQESGGNLATYVALPEYQATMTVRWVSNG